MRSLGLDNKVFDRKSARKTNFLTACFFTFFAIFTLMSAIIVNAQVNTTTSPAPKPKATPNYPKPTKPPTTGITVEVTPQTPKTPGIWQKKRQVTNESEFPAEKSIEVDPKVNIYFKSCSGNVKVNGWDRDEIRAFVKDGSEVGFKVTQKNPANGKPIILNILGYEPQKHKQLGLEECLSGEEIELDVPRGAYVNINAQDGDINISSIRKTEVTNLNGEIWIDDVSQYVYAQTFGDGDITVENSNGNVKLFSASGNITVLNVKPVEIGDILKTRTNGGAITLQSVGHSQVDSNSTSGTIKLISDISSGGQYRFITNSSILLVIPVNSSLIIDAIYGNFQSEIPMVIDNISKPPNSQLQKRTGQIGSGDAMVTMQTPSIIRIKKSN
jgi:Putative adhesin